MWVAQLAADPALGAERVTQTLGGSTGVPEHFLAVLGVLLFFGLLLPRMLGPLHLPFATSVILVGSLMGPNGLALVQRDDSRAIFGFLGGAVGNVLGSNIANILLVAGLAAMVRPLAVAELSVVYSIPIMLFFSIALLHFIRSDWRVGRDQGAISLVAYVAFLVAAFVYGWS